MPSPANDPAVKQEVKSEPASTPTAPASTAAAAPLGPRPPAQTPTPSLTNFSSTAPTPAPAPPRADPQTMVQNLGNLITMDREGKLSRTQLVHLRALLHQQTRQITVTSFLRHQPNPLLTLPPHLDPSSNADGHTALTTKEAFENAIKAATAEAPRYLLNMAKMKELLAIPFEERQKLLDTEPALKDRFQRSLTYYSRTAKTTNNANKTVNAQTGPSNANVPAVAPSTTPVNPIVAPVPVPPPPPPPVPVESEVDRRKRKLDEWMKDLGPGMAYELGLDQLLNNFMDSFVQEVAQNSVKIAKHRRSRKVEARDMAFYLDMTYGITVPGLNVSLPQHDHTASDTDRRKKMNMIAPRAARFNKAKEAKEGEQ